LPSVPRSAIRVWTLHSRLGGCPRIGIVARKWGSEAKLA
jgi:hypothetical protein